MSTNVPGQQAVHSSPENRSQADCFDIPSASPILAHVQPCRRASAPSGESACRRRPKHHMQPGDPQAASSPTFRSIEDDPSSPAHGAGSISPARSCSPPPRQDSLTTRYIAAPCPSVRECTRISRRGSRSCHTARQPPKELSCRTRFPYASQGVLGTSAVTSMPRTWLSVDASRRHCFPAIAAVAEGNDSPTAHGEHGEVEIVRLSHPIRVDAGSSHDDHDPIPLADDLLKL